MVAHELFTGFLEFIESVALEVVGQWGGVRGQQRVSEFDCRYESIV